MYTDMKIVTSQNHETEKLFWQSRNLLNTSWIKADHNFGSAKKYTLID